MLFHCIIFFRSYLPSSLSQQYRLQKEFNLDIPTWTCHFSTSTNFFVRYRWDERLFVRKMRRSVSFLKRSSTTAVHRWFLEDSRQFQRNYRRSWKNNGDSRKKIQQWWVDRTPGLRSKTKHLVEEIVQSLKHSSSFLWFLWLWSDKHLSYLIWFLIKQTKGSILLSFTRFKLFHYLVNILKTTLFKKVKVEQFPKKTTSCFNVLYNWWKKDGCIILQFQLRFRQKAMLSNQIHKL